MNSKVLIAEDCTILRQGLRVLIEKEDDLRVVAEAENGVQAVDYAQKTQPDVAVIDVIMPELNGVEATKEILKIFPQTKIIALSMYSGRRYIRDMLDAGASGYVVKDCAFKELSRAIREVIAGRTYLSSDVLEKVIRDLQKKSDDFDSIFEGLTDREQEVMHFLVDGLSTKQIANKLNLSVSTIDTHRNQLMRKLKVDNLAELIKLAIREGIITA